MMNILRTRTIAIAVALIFQMGTAAWALQPGASGNVEAPNPNAGVTSVSVSVPTYVGGSGAPLPKLTIATSGPVSINTMRLIGHSPSDASDLKPDQPGHPNCQAVRRLLAGTTTESQSADPPETTRWPRG